MKNVLTPTAPGTEQLPKETVQFINDVLKQNQEYAEIMRQLQPLLYTLSVKLYGEDDSAVTLDVLVKDAVELINPKETRQ